MLFSSFFDPVLARLRALSPEARVALLISRKFPHRAVERAKALDAEALNPEDSVVTAELVREAHGEGLAVYVFTVDEPVALQRFLDLGVDGIFTNFPERLRAIVDAGG
jgi:glycerophosphoryl diester phosphodiesterase